MVAKEDSSPQTLFYLSALGVDMVVEGESRRKLEDRYDRRPFTRRHQLRGDAVYAQIRRQGQANRLQGIL